MSTQVKPKTAPAVPRPSSSVILISPQNEILLLHRVKTSTSFASAHVFPGGNLSPQDGPCPSEGDVRRHDDAPWYRRAALRELFEESGILLARDSGEGGSGRLVAVEESEKEQARKAVHEGVMEFEQWLRGVGVGGGLLDIDNLIPFTRWITPTTNPKRFTTQMYLYFLPLPARSEPADAPENQLLNDLPIEGTREEIPIPTGDGGIEITEARFLPAAEWLHLAQKGEIMLFPPQFLLLHLISGFLDKQPRPGTNEVDELEQRRGALVNFVYNDNTTPPWTEKCISPKMLKMGKDARAVLGLDHPGPELKNTSRRGESDRVVIVRFKKGEAREVEVAVRRTASNL